MGVPVVLATAAACGSIVTSIKSSWELRRMIKRKQEAKECEEEAPYVFRQLRRAYYDGFMSTREYEQWYEKFLVAKVEKDLSGMRRIRAHIRILENGAPVAVGQRSRDAEKSGRRRHSVSFARNPTYVEWDDRDSWLEYYPDRRGRVGAHPSQFVPIERYATHSRSSSTDGGSRSRSSSARPESRGRPASRYDSYDSDDGSSDYYVEKRYRRGRSLTR